MIELTGPRLGGATAHKQEKVMLKWMGWPLAAALAFGAPWGCCGPGREPRCAGGERRARHRRCSGAIPPARGFGAGLGVGLGIGVLGAIIADEAYRPRAGYYYDDYAYDGPYDEPADFAG